MYPKDFFETHHTETKKGQCFVLMPFAEELTEIFGTIRDAVESDELNLICLRAKDLAGGGYILDDILKGIDESEVVIADLTSNNPNVFYELGIAHTRKDVEKVILLTQDMEAVPFDLRPFRCIVYKQSIAGGKDLRNELIQALRDVLQGLLRFALEEGEEWQLPKMLFGKDNCLYGIRIYDPAVGGDGAKFMLGITRKVAGRPIEQLEESEQGMPVGGAIHVPHIPWELKLDSVRDNRAIFSLSRKPK
jgi:hypothetical protein